MEILHHRLMRGMVQRTEFNKSYCSGRSSIFYCWSSIRTIASAGKWAGSLGLEFLESLLGLAYFCVHQFKLTSGPLCKSPETIFRSSLPVRCLYNSSILLSLSTRFLSWGVLACEECPCHWHPSVFNLVNRCNYVQIEMGWTCAVNETMCMCGALFFSWPCFAADFRKSVASWVNSLLSVW